jgi:hypothetical protein
MAFNFTPLQYNPYQYNNTQGPAPQWAGGEGWDSQDQFNQSQADYSAGQNSANAGAFQGYAGNQFQSLFDSVNSLGGSPMVSGSAYNNTPQYSPYEGTRAQFTTGTQPAYYNDYADDGTWIDPDGPTVFDHQGYNDARFNNINDYLSRMGSFFGNMGSDNTQAMLANMKGQGPSPIMPSVGMPSVGMGGSFNPSAGGTHGNNPFQSFGALQSGGWGTAPTSLFGAGAGNANNT